MKNLLICVATPYCWAQRRVVARLPFLAARGLPNWLRLLSRRIRSCHAHRVRGRRGCRLLLRGSTGRLL